MHAPLSATPSVLSTCGLSRVLEKGRKCQRILASQAIVFLRCVIPFAVYALLYHSASVKKHHDYRAWPLRARPGTLISPYVSPQREKLVKKAVDMAHSQAKGAWRRLPFSVPPALHYPAYRMFWLGLMASVSGYQMLRFGQFWLVYQLTGSPLPLGYVGLANGVPAICLNLFGGVFADKCDQRRLVMVTQSLTALFIFVLATLTLLHVVQVWHIVVIAFCAGAVESFDQPARQSLYPHLIDRKVMGSAVALNSCLWQGTRIIMPAVAGCIIAWTGTAFAFYLAGLGFVVMASVMGRLQVPPITLAMTTNPSPAR